MTKRKYCQVEDQNLHEILQVDYSRVLTWLTVHVIAHAVIIPSRLLLAGQVMDHGTRRNKLHWLLVHFLNWIIRHHILMSVRNQRSKTLHWWALKVRIIITITTLRVNRLPRPLTCHRALQIPSWILIHPSYGALQRILLAKTVYEHFGIRNLAFVLQGTAKQSIEVQKQRATDSSKDVLIYIEDKSHSSKNLIITKLLDNIELFDPGKSSWRLIYNNFISWIILSLIHRYQMFILYRNAKRKTIMRHIYWFFHDDDLWLILVGPKVID